MKAITIAKEILKQAQDHECAEMTPLKLMKLLYICHGIKLGAIGKELFIEPVEAWKYGPVISNVYQNTKQFGNQALSHDDLAHIPDEDISDFDKKIIDLVLSKWGHKSGPQLSSATHQADTPWYKSWNIDGGMFYMGTVIPNSEIGRHYRDLMGFSG